MKTIYNHIEIVWALLVAWLISFGVVCECVPPSHETTMVVLVLLAIGVILFTIIIRYYKFHPKGREAVKEAEEAERERRLRKEIRNSTGKPIEGGALNERSTTLTTQALFQCHKGHVIVSFFSH